MHHQAVTYYIYIQLIIYKLLRNWNQVCGYKYIGYNHQIYLPIYICKYTHVESLSRFRYLVHTVIVCFRSKPYSFFILHKLLKHSCRTWNQVEPVVVVVVAGKLLLMQMLFLVFKVKAVLHPGDAAPVRPRLPVDGLPIRGFDDARLQVKNSIQKLNCTYI